MNNIIKIWVVTIITVVAALLLPSIITYAEETEERQPIEDSVCWFVIKDGETEEKTEKYRCYDGTDTQLIHYRFILHSNNYGKNSSGVTPINASIYYSVLYNPTDDVLKQYTSSGTFYNKIQPHNYKSMHFGVVGGSRQIIQSNADYYYDFGDDDIDFDFFLDSLINDEIPADTIKLKPDYVWDDVLQEFVNPNIKYDLEIVKGVTINISDNIKDEYIIKWKPSEELQNKDYYRNVEVEIYQILNGQCKDKIWDSWQEFYFKPYLYDTPYAYKELWQGNMEGTDVSQQLVAEFLNDDNGFIANYNKSDFALRYRYVDDDNVIHYSTDYVYIQCTKDGTYTVSVPDTDDVEDITPNVPTIKVEDYTDEVIEEDTEDIEVTNIFSTIKSLFNTLKDFPTYFGKIFNMFPTWLITLMSFGIGALIIIGILKAVL